MGAGLHQKLEVEVVSDPKAVGAVVLGLTAAGAEECPSWKVGIVDGGCREMAVIHSHAREMHRWTLA